MNRRNPNVQRRFIGGLITKTKDFIGRGVDRLKKAVGSLFSNNLPKTFRDTLEKYKDNNIVNIQVCREPLAKAVSIFANLITAGTFNEESRKIGSDGFFHLFSILTLEDGTKLIYEKNERPVLQVTNKDVSKTESVSLDINDIAKRIEYSNISLGEFINNSIKKMGEERYITYDPIENNCQDFLLNSLQANNLSNGELDSFIKQNTEDLIEKTPAFSKILAQKATGLGGTLREIYEELFKKRGGIIKRRYS